jgi:hypothetical protein
MFIGAKRETKLKQDFEITTFAGEFQKGKPEADYPARNDLKCPTTSCGASACTQCPAPATVST